MVLRNPPDITIHAPTAFGTFQVEVSATGLVTHNIDITLPLQEQIKRLAQFANNLSRGAAELEKQIAALGRDLKKARADTAEWNEKRGRTSNLRFSRSMSGSTACKCWTCDGRSGVYSSLSSAPP